MLRAHFPSPKKAVINLFCMKWATGKLIILFSKLLHNLNSLKDIFLNVDLYLQLTKQVLFHINFICFR